MWPLTVFEDGKRDKQSERGIIERKYDAKVVGMQVFHVPRSSSNFEHAKQLTIFQDYDVNTEGIVKKQYK